MITRRLLRSHFAYNEKALVEAPFFRRVSRHFYIENQAEWKSIKYGWHPRSNMAYSGCGVIAVWNLLVYYNRVPRVGTAAALSNLIGDFERCATVMGGALGTSAFPMFFYVKSIFKKARFSFWKPESSMNRFGESFDAFIVTTMNDAKNITRGLHIVCITKDSRGYSVHNSYKKTRTGYYVVSIPYKTLSEAIDNINERPFPVAVIGVREDGLNSH